jgi:3-dehydroquinate synthase
MFEPQFSSETKSVPVKLSQASYDIRIAPGLIGDLRNHLRQTGLQEPFLVVSQARVLKAVSREFDPEFTVVCIPDGERAKTLKNINRLIDAMVKNRLTRQSTLIALGGGVVGDVAGFAASIFLRGISFVQVPTTLLAQVDSSIGGKTGVNHRVAKNLIGTFYQPRLVLTDPSVLLTLADREYRSGLYEAVKYGVISSPELFTQFESDVEPVLKRELDSLEKLVYTCAKIKARIVGGDEREGDLRRVLNFGHTVGHGIEAAGNYERIKHGEAVGYGMIAAARIATTMGRLSDGDRARIENVVRSIGRLPNLTGLQARKVFNAIQHDKKVRDGKIHFVLPRAIGRVEIAADVPFATVGEVVTELLHGSRKNR